MNNKYMLFSNNIFQTYSLIIQYFMNYLVVKMAHTFLKLCNKYAASYIYYITRQIQYI